MTSLDDDFSGALKVDLQSPSARVVVINEVNASSLEQLAAAPSSVRCLVLICPNTPEETAREVARRLDEADFTAAPGTARNSDGRNMTRRNSAPPNCTFFWATGPERRERSMRLRSGLKGPGRASGAVHNPPFFRAEFIAASGPMA